MHDGSLKLLVGHITFQPATLTGCIYQCRRTNTIVVECWPKKNISISEWSSTVGKSWWRFMAHLSRTIMALWQKDDRQKWRGYIPEFWDTYCTCMSPDWARKWPCFGGSWESGKENPKRSVMKTPNKGSSQKQSSRAKKWRSLKLSKEDYVYIYILARLGNEWVFLSTGHRQLRDKVAHHIQIRVRTWDLLFFVLHSPANRFPTSLPVQFLITRTSSWTWSRQFNTSFVTRFWMW